MNLSYDFYVQPMHWVYIEAAAMFLIWTVMMLFVRGGARRVIGWFGVVLSVVLIVMLTIHGRKIGTKTDVSLIPFISFVNAKLTPEVYRSLFMNMLLFLPLGLSLPFALPDTVRHKLLLTCGSGVVLSVTVEALQYLFSMGRCETDDVLMNTLGVVVGMSSYGIVRLVARRRRSNADKSAQA